MRGITTSLLRTIILVLFIAIGFLFVAPLIGLDWISYLQMGQNFFSSPESSYLNTQRDTAVNHELDYSGFMLDPDAGYDEATMRQILRDSNICDKIKGCIEYYDLNGNTDGCEVLTLERAEGSKFPMDELVSIVQSCESEIQSKYGSTIMKTNVGGVDKEICYLDTTKNSADNPLNTLFAGFFENAPFSELQKVPQSFYYNVKKCKVKSSDLQDSGVKDSYGPVTCDLCTPSTLGAIIDLFGDVGTTVTEYGGDFVQAGVNAGIKVVEQTAGKDAANAVKAGADFVSDVGKKSGEFLGSIGKSLFGGGGGDGEGGGVTSRICKYVQALSLGQTFKTNNSLIYLAMDTSRDGIDKPSFYALPDSNVKNKDDNIAKDEGTDGKGTNENFHFNQDYNWPTDDKGNYKFSEIKTVYGVGALSDDMKKWIVGGSLVTGGASGIGPALLGVYGATDVGVNLNG